MGLFSKGFSSFGLGLNSLGLSSLGSLKSQFDGSSQQKDANKMAMLSWNIANDYNHPINQMARLEAAGLNKNLVYGSGSVTGNTASAPSLQGGGVSTFAESAFKGLSNIISTKQGFANIANTEAQRQASTAAAGASSAQAANLNAQATINEARGKYEEKSLIADLDYKKALAEKTKAEASIAQGEADIFGSVGGNKGVKTFSDGLRSFGRFARGFFK